MPISRHVGEFISSRPGAVIMVSTARDERPLPQVCDAGVTDVRGYTPSYHTMIHLLRGAIPEGSSAVVVCLGVSRCAAGTVGQCVCC